MFERRIQHRAGPADQRLQSQDDRRVGGRIDRRTRLGAQSGSRLKMTFIFSQHLLVSIAVALVSTLFVTLLYLLLRAHAEKNFYTPFFHIRQICFVTFPTVFSFCVLVFNSPIIYGISTFLVIILMLGCIEALLRRFAGTTNRKDLSPKAKKLRWGLLVPFEEAKFATGNYPREYLTEEFVKSIRHPLWRKWPVNEFRTSDPNICFDENSNIDVDNFSIRNGLRTTTDQPEKHEFTILLFGGSTTLMEEVPDDLTYASYLQRRLNLDKKVRVVNHGTPGATVLNRASFLINRTPVNKGDIVVFYFGVNDSGASVRGKSWLSLRSPFLVLLEKLAIQRFEIGKWVHGEILHRHNFRCSITAYNSTISAISEAKKFVASHGAKFMVVLQPNLFVSKTKSDYEKSLRLRWSRSFIPEQVNICYPKYELFVNQCDFGISLSHIFDNLESSVYLDWCHVNARGAEIIAESLHLELIKLHYV